MLACAAATALETALVIALVHLLLRYPMEERGVVPWRVSDTLLTAPLFVVGVVVLSFATNRMVAGAVSRGAVVDGSTAPGALSGSGWAVWGGVAVIGLLMGGFGVRAAGKLY